MLEDPHGFSEGVSSYIRNLMKAKSCAQDRSFFRPCSSEATRLRQQVGDTAHIFELHGVESTNRQTLPLNQDTFLVEASHTAQPLVRKQQSCATVELPNLKTLRLPRLLELEKGTWSSPDVARRSACIGDRDATIRIDVERDRTRLRGRAVRTGSRCRNAGANTSTSCTARELEY